MALPDHFVEDVNDIGRLVRRYDELRSTDKKRRLYLDEAVHASCSLLRRLGELQEALEADIRNLQGNNADILALIRDAKQLDLFRKVERVVMRDLGIDTISRNLILNNLRRLKNISENNVHQILNFNEKEATSTLRNLTNEVCERARVVDTDSEVKRRVDAVQAWVIVPINTAGGIVTHVLGPLFFKTSVVVGTVVTTVALSRMRRR